MLPKKQKFFKYIKKTKAKEYSKELLEIISTYFACSHSEASSYLDILKKEEVKKPVTPLSGCARYSLCRQFGFRILWGEYS